MIDASIPFRAGTAGQFSLADIAQQSQQMRHADQTMQQRERQLDQTDQRFDLEMQKLTAEMSKEQREAAAEGLKDMAAAVQWANTPEQWAVVQRHLGQHNPELASVPFERREEVLVSTGRMADFLELNKPEIRAIEAGGSLAAVNPHTGQPTFTVLPNPGGMQPGSPAGPQGGGGQPRMSGTLTFEMYRGAVNGLGPEGAASFLQRNNHVITVNTPQEAAQLPPGTRYITPDGQGFVR
jgi:hypothetical protein